MATKYINRHPKSRQEIKHDNWQVMKPFVHFAVKSMVIIAGALVTIIKMVPELLEHHKDQPKKDDRIIKI